MTVDRHLDPHFKIDGTKHQAMDARKYMNRYGHATGGLVLPLLILIYFFENHVDKVSEKPRGPAHRFRKTAWAGTPFSKNRVGRHAV
eukprot:COSAG06_NODE_14978_length_1109_cov_5.328713_2_plen_86_part_01